MKGGSAMVRVRFEGRSYDLLEYELDVTVTMTDREIKENLARFFFVRADRLRDYTVDRSPSGHLDIRPEADSTMLVTA
jgi:hypothetical protein